jgi:hypothetical protein
MGVPVATATASTPASIAATAAVKSAIAAEEAVKAARFAAEAAAAAAAVETTIALHTSGKASKGQVEDAMRSAAAKTKASKRAHDESQRTQSSAAAWQNATANGLDPNDIASAVTELMFLTVADEDVELRPDRMARFAYLPSHPHNDWLASRDKATQPVYVLDLLEDDVSECVDPTQLSLYYTILEPYHTNTDELHKSIHNHGVAPSDRATLKRKLTQLTNEYDTLKKSDNNAAPQQMRHLEKQIRETLRQQYPPYLNFLRRDTNVFQTRLFGIHNDVPYADRGHSSVSMSLWHSAHYQTPGSLRAIVSLRDKIPDHLCTPISGGADFVTEVAKIVSAQIDAKVKNGHRDPRVHALGAEVTQRATAQEASLKAKAATEKRLGDKQVASSRVLLTSDHARMRHARIAYHSLELTDYTKRRVNTYTYWLSGDAKKGSHVSWNRISDLDVVGSELIVRAGHSIQTGTWMNAIPITKLAMLILRHAHNDRRFQNQSRQC